MRKLLFRCDGGKRPEVGTGHVRRCLLLADKLKEDEEFEIAFLMENGSEEIKRVSEMGYKVYTMDTKRNLLEQTIEAIKDFAPEILVSDILNSEEGYVKGVKDAGVIVIVLDDIGPGQKCADIKINAILETGLSLFEGPKYIVLPEKSPKKTVTDRCTKIFMSFGGYDHLNITLKTLKALEPLDEKIEITAAIGDYYKYEEELNSFLKNAKRKFIIHFKPQNFDELFNQADLAIVSGGLTLFEAMARGIPSIVIGQYEHQIKTARRYESRNALICLGMGNRVDERTIFEKVIELIEDRSLRKLATKNGLRLVDGMGLKRVSELIKIVSILKWDSDFFGVKIAALHTLRINLDIMRYTFRLLQERASRVPVLSV